MKHALESLDDFRTWVAAAILTPAWAWVQVHWAAFWWSSPLVWICLFWGADWVLGSSRALYSGWAHPEDPTRGWKPRRAARSVFKLVTWVAVLMLAWGLRDSAGMGGQLAASCIEAGVLLTEAGSVMGHLAEISGLSVLRVFASKMKQQTGDKNDAQVPQ